ncbi:hypothetical protein GF337_17130 [candidate division KSB1 bacterium]|nr:hypothetical protein [candidate division KSB1 bacterium]
MNRSTMMKILITVILIPCFCYGGIPYKLSDFVKMNLGVHTSDSEDQFISMLHAYNHAYGVRYSIRQLYNNIVRTDELFSINSRFTSKAIARTTGISSRFGWYDPADPVNSRQSLFGMDGEYFGYFYDVPRSVEPGIQSIGFYLDATEYSHPAYTGGLWYSQSAMNSDVGNFDHLIALRAPDEWLARNSTIGTSYLLCWEDMFWRGGSYSKRFRDGYSPNSYIPELGVYQSDRDYNDFMIQIDQIVAVPESGTLLLLLLGSILLFGMKYYTKHKDEVLN